jgi:hypothetical protein
LKDSSEAPVTLTETSGIYSGHAGFSLPAKTGRIKGENTVSASVSGEPALCWPLLADRISAVFVL